MFNKNPHETKLKICRSCKKELPLSSFPKNKDLRKKLGYTIKSDCFACHAKRNLDWYYKTRPPLKVYSEAHKRKMSVARQRYMKYYMRKRRRLPREAYSPDYFKPVTSPSQRFTFNDLEEIRTSNSPSPSPEEWEKQSQESQARILERRG